MVGPAVDEAAQYHELAQWIGVSATPSVHHILSNIIGDPDPRELFVKWDLPLKIGVEKNAWVVNWLSESKVKSKDMMAEKLFGKVREIILKEAQTTDIVNALKWRNTQEFVERNS